VTSDTQEPIGATKVSGPFLAVAFVSNLRHA